MNTLIAVATLIAIRFVIPVLALLCLGEWARKQTRTQARM
jgi:hypothetical protein